jgi:hypothetical protein
MRVSSRRTTSGGRWKGNRREGEEPAELIYFKGARNVRFIID